MYHIISMLPPDEINMQVAKPDKSSPSHTESSPLILPLKLELNGNFELSVADFSYHWLITVAIRPECYSREVRKVVACKVCHRLYHPSTIEYIPLLVIDLDFQTLPQSWWLLDSRAYNRHAVFLFIHPAPGCQLKLSPVVPTMFRHIEPIRQNNKETERYHSQQQNHTQLRQEYILFALIAATGVDTLHWSVQERPIDIIAGRFVGCTLIDVFAR